MSEVKNLDYETLKSAFNEAKSEANGSDDIRKFNDIVEMCEKIEDEYTKRFQYLREQIDLYKLFRDLFDLVDESDNDIKEALKFAIDVLDRDIEFESDD